MNFPVYPVMPEDTVRFFCTLNVGGFTAKQLLEMLAIYQQPSARTHEIIQLSPEYLQEPTAPFALDVGMISVSQVPKEFRSTIGLQRWMIESGTTILPLDAVFRLRKRYDVFKLYCHVSDLRPGTLSVCRVVTFHKPITVGDEFALLGYNTSNSSIQHFWANPNHAGWSEADVILVRIRPDHPCLLRK